MTKLLARSSIDLLVLDWHSRRISGTDVLRSVRVIGHSKLPVLFASRDAENESVVRAFALGADDYVGLPAHPSLFRARVEALLRRAYIHESEDFKLEVGGYCFNRRRHEVTAHGVPIALSDTQYRLANLFFSNVGRLLSREHIFAAVWGRELREVTRTIDSHVSRLRLLMKIDPDTGFELQSVYKTGYRLTDLRTTTTVNRAIA